MSDATLHAIHDAIAAHIADVNEDDPEFLAEWVIIASAAVSTNRDATSYYYLDSDIPYHHASGLLDWGRTHLKNGRLTAMLADDEDL